MIISYAQNFEDVMLRRTKSAQAAGQSAARERALLERIEALQGEMRCLKKGNSDLERKLHRIENQIVLLMSASGHRFNQMNTAMAGLHDLVLQQTQSILATMGPQNHTDIQPIQTPESDGLKQLSPSARRIYFLLKNAAVNHAQAARGA